MDDPLPSIQHSHHNNNSKDNDNAPELIPTEDQDPPQTSKCFTLACIVVFVALVANSIPTLLSPQPRTNPRSSSSSSLSKRTGPSESSPGRILASAFAQHQHPSRQQPLQQQQQQQQQQQPNQQAEFDAIGGSLVYTTDDPSVASSSFNTFRDKQRQVDRLSPKESSRTHPSQHQQHQQHQQREPLIEKTTISELVLIVVNVLVRVAWWSILLLYRACRYLVLGPAGIIMSLLDTPISMMREIYKTVMPVYSFFTVAAVIGVVVGGSATWIGQLLISALGADQDKNKLQLQQKNTRVLPLPPTSSSSSSPSPSSAYTKKRPLPPPPLLPRQRTTSSTSTLSNNSISSISDSMPRPRSRLGGSSHSPVATSGNARVGGRVGGDGGGGVESGGGEGGRGSRSGIRRETTTTTITSTTKTGNSAPSDTRVSANGSVGTNGSHGTVYHGRGQDLVSGGEKQPRSNGSRGGRQGPPPHRREYDYEDDDDDDDYDDDDDDESDWHHA